jgi:hypothetical protein
MIDSTATNKSWAPRLALLGVCDRARREQGNQPVLSHIDILGLRKVVLPYIYPFDASNLYLALAIYGIELSNPGSVVLRNRQGNELFRVNMITTELSSENSKDNKSSDKGMLVAVGDIPSWTVFLVPLKDVVLNEPQTVEAFLLGNGDDISLGVLSFGLAGAHPLTPDRIAAIKSDPRAIKALRLQLGCKYCDSKLKVTAALEKHKSDEGDAIWYQDVPDSFDCSCGKTHMNLDIIRTNMHALLGQRNMSAKNLSFSALYEERAIDLIAEEFLQLLRSTPKEEEVQQFISKNPIIFHFLSPLRLFEKPPILSKHQADFAILDSRGSLIFVEIERPNILLLRKDGATSAEMEHAISQVRDWLFLYEKHRSAVLECLDLQDREVTRVKGLVIAGRDEGHKTEDLRKFKWQDRGAIDCMTYDDLLNICATLIREMKAM